MKRVIHKGFSLAEVLVAMFVIVVGIAGTTATIWWGMKQGDTGKVTGEASNLARIVIENILAQNPYGAMTTAPPLGDPLNNAPDERIPVDAPAGGWQVFESHQNIDASNGSVHSDLSRFTRNISITPLATSGTSYDRHLATLTVQIFWEKSEGQVGPNGVPEGRVQHEVIVPFGGSI